MIQLKKQLRKGTSPAVATVLMIIIVLGIAIAVFAFARSMVNRIENSEHNYPFTKERQKEIYNQSRVNEDNDIQKKSTKEVQKLKHLRTIVASFLEFIKKYPEILVPPLLGLALYKYLARRGNLQ